MIEDNTPIFKVSQVAKHLKMSADRLRTYDEELLVMPIRENKVRLYSNNDIAWLENLREVIKKDKLSILGFKELLRVSYVLNDKEFNKFVSKQEEFSVWKIIAKMRTNPNYEKFLFKVILFCELKKTPLWSFFNKLPMAEGD